MASRTANEGGREQVPARSGGAGPLEPLPHQEQDLLKTVIEFGLKVLDYLHNRLHRVLEQLARRHPKVPYRHTRNAARPEVGGCQLQGGGKVPKRNLRDATLSHFRTI